MGGTTEARRGGRISPGLDGAGVNERCGYPLGHPAKPKTRSARNRDQLLRAQARRLHHQLRMGVALGRHHSCPPSGSETACLEEAPDEFLIESLETLQQSVTLLLEGQLSVQAELAHLRLSQPIELKSEMDSLNTKLDNIVESLPNMLLQVVLTAKVGDALVPMPSNESVVSSETIVGDSRVANPSSLFALNDANCEMFEISSDHG